MDFSKTKYSQLQPTLLNAPPSRALYKLRSNTIQKDHTNRIAKCELGILNPNAPPPGKVLMLLGQTGSGKTTLINSLINHILGVKWEDPFRFTLITSADESATGAPVSQTQSQTQWVTIYVIHKMDCSVLPFTLTVIDTPGYGDCTGLERDKAITTQISSLVQNPSLYGLTELHGIGFVVQASAVRLTRSQKYIYDSMLAILGKDLGKNILIATTFSDAGKILVEDAIKEENIPYCGIFKFNSCSIFAEQDDDEDRCSLMKISYSMTNKQIRNFLLRLGDIESQTFVQTGEVLKKRLLLEETIKALAPEIKKTLVLLDNLEQERKVLHEYEACSDADHPYESELLVRETVKIDLKPNEHVTNCLVCSMTCHYPCYIPNDDGKYRCDAMKEPKDDSTTCTQCPRGCSWRNHSNQQFRYEIRENSVPKTSENLKRELAEKKITVDRAINEIEMQVGIQNEKILTMMGEVQRCIKRLEEIALKSNPLDEVEYIELLINSEVQRQDKGYETRIKYYEEAKKNAKLLSCIASDTTQQLRLDWYKEIRSKVFV